MNFHSGGFGSPQFQIDHVEVLLPVGRGFEVAVFFRWEPPFQFDQSGLSPPGDSQVPDPNGYVQSQSQTAALSQTSVGIAGPTGGQVPLRSEPGVNATSPVSLASTFGLTVVGNNKSQTSTLEGGRDGAERLSASPQAEGMLAGADGVAVTAGKDVAQEAAGIGNGQLEAAATSLPAQLAALLDHDSLLYGKFAARSNPPAGADRTSVAGLVATDRGKIDQQCNVSIGLTALGFAADGSPLARRGQAVLPDPHSADLIDHVLPGDRDALDRAIDQFFKQDDEVDGRGAGGQGPARIVFLSAALAGSFAGLDIVRRRWRHWKAGDDFARDPVGGGDHIGFPELPGSWSSRLS